MLYPTHKRYGILWGVLTIPIAVAIGLIPVINSELRNGDIFIITMTILIGMIGALFGARFPDIDSPTSIPSRRHPFLHKIFRALGIKHRGKFSHDFASIGALFLFIYFAVSNIGEKLIIFVSESESTVVYSLSYLTIVVIVYLIGLEIVSELQDLANKIKNKRMWAILDKRKYLIALINVAWLMIVLVFSGIFNLKALVTGNIGLTNAMWSTTTTVVLLKVFVIFTLAGAYSHLYADMTTKSGVSIFGIKLAPTQVILKLKKIPVVGKILVPTEFKTGSKWEDFNRNVVSLLILPSIVLATLFLFGFNLNEILHFFKR